jgi:hypothetical protein
MKIPHHRKSSGRNGFALILVLLITSALAYLSLSSFSSIESKVAIQRQQTDSVRAELAAQAGIEHAKMMILANQSWAGTDDWVNLGTSTFQVTTTVAGENIEVAVEGRSGDGKRVLTMEYQVRGAESEMEGVGCWILTSNIDMSKCHFNTNLFVADQAGAVYDYKLDELGNQIWTLNTDNLGSTLISNTMVNHTAYQFSESDWFKGSYNKVIMDDPFYMPSWNLDSYLIPGSDRIILYGVEELSEVNFQDTVVVVLDPGDTFNVNDCNLHGGLVVYVEPDWDLRSGKRNTVSIDKSLIGSPSSPGIGVIAPACEVKGGGDHINIHGWSFWNSVDDMDKGHVNGALIIVNQVDDLDSFNMHGHPQVIANPPEGIQFNEGTPELDLVIGGEDIS